MPLSHISKAHMGFSLIEVMVSVFVLGLGLLGLAGLQVTGVKSNHTAMTHTQSTQLIYDLADRMRANKVGAQAGNYLTTTAYNESYDCVGNAKVCTPKEMAHADIDWVFSLASATMPFVSASITCKSPAGVVVASDTSAKNCPEPFTHLITVTWREQAEDGLKTKTTTVEFQP